MTINIPRRLKPSAFLLRGREPEIDVRWWVTPLGSGQRWEDLLPGRCAKCLAPVRMMSHTWWETPTRQHTICAQPTVHPADVSERKPVTNLTRGTERRMICARYGLTQDEYEALPKATRMAYHRELRADGMSASRTERRAHHDSQEVRS